MTTVKAESSMKGTMCCSDSYSSISTIIPGGPEYIRISGSRPTVVLEQKDERLVRSWDPTALPMKLTAVAVKVKMCTYIQPSSKYPRGFAARMCE